MTFVTFNSSVFVVFKHCNCGCGTVWFVESHSDNTMVTCCI